MKTNKKTLLFVTCLVLLFSVGMSQAAVMELQGLPATIKPNTAGSITFDVVLTGIDGPEVQAFGFQFEATGAPGLLMPAGSVVGPARSDYIFYNDSFAFSAGNPTTGNSLAVGDVANSTDKNYQPPGLLGQVTLEYEAMPACTWIEFTTSGGETDNAIIHNSSTFEYETLQFKTDYAVHVVPIPGAIWLMASGILGLLGIKSRMKTK